MTEKNESSQRERFESAARDVGADTSEDALERAFGKLNVKRPPAKKATGKKKTPDT